MADPPTAHPDQDTQLVAVFENRPLAESARHALLSVGVPGHAIELVDHSSDSPAIEAESGFWAALGRLFAPHDEAHELSNAIGQGHAMVVVHPADAAEREVAIEALEGCGPLDLDERRGDWNSQATIESQPIAVVPTISEPARAHMVRIVEERLRVGWREIHVAPGRVRQYSAVKPEDRQRVQLEEEEIPPPGDPAPRS